MPELTFHGCFGRFAGDASEPIDFLSSEWTQVRNKKRKGEKKKRISKLSCNWKFAKRNATLEVAPEEQVAYHTKNNQKTLNNGKLASKKLKITLTNKLKQKKFQNHVSNLTEQDLEQKLKDLLKNDIKLQEEKEGVISNLKSAKESLGRSAEIIKAQKKLYELLMEFEMNRRSTYWNSVIGRHSFHNSNINPLQEEMNKNKNKLEKAVRQLNILDHTVKENLYTLQKTYGNRFKLHHEYQNYSCLNHGYNDHYGIIHEEYQPYPSEESKCYGNILPRRKIPKYTKVQESFRRRKHRYQQALTTNENTQC
jgi:hypothetical protein